MRGWGGASWIHDSHNHFDATYKTGYAFGASCGSTWFRIMRTELEVLRFYNTLDHVKMDGQHTSLKGHLAANVAFFNIQFRSPCTLSCLELTPYFGVGAGGGTARTKLHGEGVPKINDTNHHSAYQFFGGLSTVICPLVIGDLSLEVEGRYLVFDKKLRAAMAVGGLTIKF